MAMGILDKSRIKPHLVIVVEDEPLIRRFIVEILNDEKFEVFCAQHAADALKLIDVHASRISVLFTDIDMPGSMNGLQLANHVQGRWPWIAILITSGKQRPLATEMPHSGRFLAKPYAHTSMIRHVRELCPA